MATEVEAIIRQLSVDQAAPLSLREAAADLLPDFPVRPDEIFAALPFFRYAAECLVRGARLLRRARSEYPDFSLFADAVRAPRAALLCAVAFSPWPMAGLPPTPDRASDLPQASRAGETATVTSLIAAAHGGNEDAIALNAANLDVSYEMQSLIDRGTRALQLGKGVATSADWRVAEDLASFRRMGNIVSETAEESDEDDIPVTPGQRITGMRLMLPAAAHKNLRQGEVRDAFGRWLSVQERVTAFHAELGGHDPADLQLDSVAFLSGDIFWQIWHFDATGLQMVVQNTPGLATRVVRSFPELDGTLAENLSAILRFTGEVATELDAQSTPALYAHGFVAATASLLRSGTAARAARREHAAMETGTAPGDLLQPVVRGQVVGGMACIVEGLVTHGGPERGKDYSGRAEEQHSDILAGYAGPAEEALRAGAEAAFRKYPGTVLDRQAVFVAFRQPKPKHWTQRHSCAGKDYTTDYQIKPDVAMHELHLYRTLPRELVLLRDDGHTDIADFYPTRARRDAFRALLDAVDRGVMPLDHKAPLPQVLRSGRGAAILAALLSGYGVGSENARVIDGRTLIEAHAAARTTQTRGEPAYAGPFRHSLNADRLRPPPCRRHGNA